MYLGKYSIYLQKKLAILISIIIHAALVMGKIPLALWRLMRKFTPVVVVAFVFVLFILNQLKSSKKLTVTYL